ncbi:MAG TPA: Hpt domain-containing protein [Lacipirellula sp.]
MLEKTFDTCEASPRVAHGVGSQVFDMRAALERLDGDEELFEMLAQVFQQDSVALYEQLSVGMAAGDLAHTQRVAHSLKGLCANFDAQHATEAAFMIEDMARRGSSAGLGERVAELGSHLEELRHALGQRLA